MELSLRDRVAPRFAMSGVKQAAISAGNIALENDVVHDVLVVAQIQRSQLHLVPDAIHAIPLTVCRHTCDPSRAIGISLLALLLPLLAFPPHFDQPQAVWQEDAGHGYKVTKPKEPTPRHPASVPNTKLRSID